MSCAARLRQLTSREVLKLVHQRARNACLPSLLPRVTARHVHGYGVAARTEPRFDLRAPRSQLAFELPRVGNDFYEGEPWSQLLAGS